MNEEQAEVNVNAQDSSDQMLLHEAASRNAFGAVEKLLNKGLDANARIIMVLRHCIQR